MSSAGANWAKWDLHVHTPLSIWHQYTGANTDAVWERFLTELEALPPELKVLGVNDYWFLDGYEKLVADRAAGRVANIETIFPVVEMRVDAFGGTKNDLSRANLHVIFDPDLPPAEIRGQFLSSLSAKFVLSADDESLVWNQTVTAESLATLGAQIRQSLPDEHKRSSESDTRLGFDSLAVPLGKVTELVESNTALKGRVLLGLGKTEWADIKWSGQSTASKKTLANTCQILFTALETPEGWKHQREVLTAANVTDALLDCSDAHYWADSGQKDRIGNCWTWLRAERSFAGLCQALLEFDGRVFVGLEPPDLARLRSEPETILQRISVASNDGRGRKPFGNYSVDLNQRYVAIVGNKGQGKSALLDSIARAGNSSRDEFAFLNTARFLAPKSLAGASRLSALAEWASGESRSVALSKSYDPSSLERVEYLPQSFVERVCSSDPRQVEAEEFEVELKRILFTHIEEQDRRGASSFDELLESRASTLDKEIVARRLEIGRAAEQIERLLAELWATTGAALRGQADELEAALSLAKADLDAAESTLVDAVSRAPQSAEKVSADELLAKLTAQRESLSTKLSTDSKAEGELAERLERATAGLAELESEAANLQDSAQRLAGLLEISQASLLTIRIDRTAAADALSVMSDRLAALRAAREETVASIGLIDAQLKEVQLRLEAIDQFGELARRQRDQQKARVDAIEGTDDDPDSLRGLRSRIARHESLPALIEEERAKLTNLAGAVWDLLSKRLDTVATLYAPAKKFIDENPIARDAGIAFRADFVLGDDEWKSIVEMLDLRKSADLTVKMQSFGQRVDLHDRSQLLKEIVALESQLGSERGRVGGAKRDPRDAVRSKSQLSEVISGFFSLEWVQLRFGLSGQSMTLRELSPGQRGLILLLFYLVVDKRNIPLLLDQPEENLDNDTIRRVLVPALRDAASRRQLLVVTHNANLAIVGDADQIVHCTVSSSGQFVLQAASSADATIARASIDVLEGTSNAFRARSKHYQAVKVL